MRYLLLFLLLFVVSCSSVDEDKEKELRIEHAKAVVKLYDLRLHDMKHKAKMDDFKNADIKRKYLTAKKCYETGSLSERSYREAKMEYDISLHQHMYKDIQQAETLLEIAKIRLKMAEAGMKVPIEKIRVVGEE